MADFKKATFSTTINEKVLNDFRTYCTKINCPMNMVLEVFMAQFARGQFEFKLKRNKIELDTNENI